MKTLLAALLCLFICIMLNAQQVPNVADSNNLFAFKLYDEISQAGEGGNENLFFSPFSISAALAMTYAGARNETEKQMRNTLHFSLEQVPFQREYKSYLEKIASDTGHDLIMGIANSLWIASPNPINGAKGIKLLNPFTEIVTTDYNSEAKNVDFSKTEQTRQEINQWVEQKTNDKIKELIKRNPPVIDANTRLVLVNAIYFKGKWKARFSKDSTKNEVFYKSSSSTIKADFMHNTTRYKYYEDDLLQAVELPYSGDKTSMIVFLPKERDGINDMENQLEYFYYLKIASSLHSQKVILALPKFNTTAEFELKDALSKLGMPVAFSDNADFSGISNESLEISHVIHKAFIDVNEEGTEAVAATAVTMKMMAMRPLPVPVFIANHSFIFVIRDNATGSILFMGKISNPAN